MIVLAWTQTIHPLVKLINHFNSTTWFISRKLEYLPETKSTWTWLMLVEEVFFMVSFEFVFMGLDLECIPLKKMMFFMNYFLNLFLLHKNVILF